MDAVEAAVLTGCSDHGAAAGVLQTLGVRTVLLTHRDGVPARDTGGTSEAAWGGWTLEGRTGRGDTCTAAFLVGLDRGLDRAAALSLAARVTSEKMSYRGPYRGMGPPGEPPRPEAIAE